MLSIEASVAAASRRYAQVAERPSRAQACIKPASCQAGQQHAREQVASICMPCAAHLKVATATGIFFAISCSSAPWSQGLGPTPSATTRESCADREHRGASARCKVSRRSRWHASDQLDAVLGVRKGWVCKRLASGLTCLPITAVEVVRSCCHGSDRCVKREKRCWK